MTETGAFYQLELGQRYLKFESVVHEQNWVDAFENFLSSPGYRLPEALVLIHPRWYREMDKDRPYSGRDRRFSTSFKGNYCRSLDVWGYSCPLKDEPIEVDHIFPWSLGGLTTKGNAMFLCQKHNRLKGADVHFMGWRLLENSQWAEHLLKDYVRQIRETTGTKYSVDWKTKLML